MNTADEQELSPVRMEQIVALAAKGQRDKEIAQELGISAHTVATHWKRSRRKLGVRNRAAVVTALLTARIEEQNQQLQEAHDELQRLHLNSQKDMSALLSGSQKRVIGLETRVKELDFLERASHVAHATAYELSSVEPVSYRHLSSSAKWFAMNVKSLLAGESTFYETIVPEDLALVYEKSLEARWLPNERYLYLYRMKMPEPRWVLDMHQGFHDSAGALTGVIGMAIDVHDLVSAGLLIPAVSRLIVPADPIPTPAPLL